MKSITAAEANRRLSSVMYTLAQGEIGLTTLRGKSVTSIARADPDATRVVPEQTRQEHLEHLLTVRPTDVPRDWIRDELCER